MHTLSAARDLRVGDAFETDGETYVVRALHTDKLEGFDRFNKVALEARDLNSTKGRVYLFVWDANKHCNVIGRLAQVA